MLLLPLLLACNDPESGKTDTSPPSDSGQPQDSAQPCDDPDTEDFDGDGISDIDECAVGTDPQDPGSASAWHPEWTARPRLLIGPDELPLLVEVMEAKEEPGPTLQARVRSACDSAVPEPEDTYSYLTSQGNIALACAVESALGDVKAGEKAVGILEAMTADTIPLDLIDTADLRIGQGLLQGVRAWDLLLGTGYPADHDPAVAEAALHALGDLLWQTFMVDWAPLPAVWRNNHNTKLAASLAMLGMGAWDDPRSARYVDFAATEIPAIHDEMMATDGGYAEGPAYLSYAMESEFPWFRAMRKWLGEGEMLAMTQCEHDLDPECIETLVTVTDPLDDPRVCDSWDRFVETLMPSGYAPNTDDANLSSGILGLAAGMCGSGTMAWGWGWQTQAWYTGGSVNVAPDSLLEWWLAPAPIEPAIGVIRADAAGYVVLRESWERDASWAMLLAESGIANNAGGHEQPDALAFLWSAPGAGYALIDSGYGSWTQREDVAKPEAHNTLLVDGEGSSGIDSTVVDAWADGPFQIARGSVELGGVAWERTLVMVNDILVVLDRTDPLDGASHELSLRFQGANESWAWGTDGEAEGCWTMGELAISLRTVATESLLAESFVESHAFDYGIIESHVAMGATLDTAKPARFLTVARVHPLSDGCGLDGGTESTTWENGEADLLGQLRAGDAMLDLNVP